MKPMHLITGGPKTGKTTRAGANAEHMDDLGKDRAGWDERLNVVAAKIRGTGAEVIEGVVIPHALRRVLRDSPTARMDHVSVEYLTRPYGTLSRGQQAMTKGARTVWEEIKPELLRRGAKITER